MTIYLTDDAFNVKAKRFNKMFTTILALFFLLRIANKSIFILELSFGPSSTGVSNSWASGGHIAYMSSRAEDRLKFWIWRSPLLWATISVMLPEVRSISKKKESSSPFQQQ